MVLAPALLALALAATAPAAAAPGPAPAPCVEVLALADLHGRIGELPRLAAAMAPVRAAGRSLLLDAGDSLQGTLEASLSSGAAVVAGYAALGVDASVVGNHDLDFGQEALRRRMEEAPYPFLAANLRDRATRRLPAWRNLHASRLFHVPGGPVVGVFGLASPETPRETMPGNVAGLGFGPLAQEAQRQAAALRARGASLVVGVLHGGGSCRSLADASDLSSCDPRSTIFRLAETLPGGTVDALVGGHSHGFVAHRVNGVAVLQAGSKGEAAGWVTLCPGAPPAFHAFLRGGEAVDARVQAAVAPFLEAARAERERSTGVRLEEPLTRSSRRGSGLGAAAAQGARHAMGADVGVVNAGGLRADLPAGELRQGALFDALPFDDGVARLSLTGDELAAFLRALSAGRQGTARVAGIRLDGDRAVTCSGAPLDPGRTYLVAMNEFLAAGGDGTRAVVSRLPAASVEIRRDLHLRDALLAWLRKAPPDRAAQGCP